jgi:hypothetical protein
VKDVKGVSEAAEVTFYTFRYQGFLFITNVFARALEYQ